MGNSVNDPIGVLLPLRHQLQVLQRSRRRRLQLADGDGHRGSAHGGPRALARSICRKGRPLSVRNTVLPMSQEGHFNHLQQVTGSASLPVVGEMVGTLRRLRSSAPSRLSGATRLVQPTAQCGQHVANQFPSDLLPPDGRMASAARH
jgi:hypothetical protein